MKPNETCAGIGGVGSFQSKKRGQVLIPDLAAFVWEGRTVILAFDSDCANRPDLMAQLMKLADEVTRRGAEPLRVDLPALADGAKGGLDDFLLTNSIKDFEALPRERFEMSRELLALNAD